uniref:Uncharacterized protein n=1 Tax=Ditylenchus dipsaci TaxID=166011 RepID=A0A915DK64_9BILA
MRASSRSIWMVLLFVCASWPCGVLAEANDSLPTILLKKGSSKSITLAIIAPSPDKIDFTIVPLDCNAGDDVINKVKYSYSSGCIMDLIWEKGSAFCTRKVGGSGSNTVSASESTNISISIQAKEVKFKGQAEYPIYIKDGCPVKNEQLSDGTIGYLLNFTMWSTEELQCGYRLRFPPEYKVFVPPIDPTTVAASQALGAWDIVAIVAAIVVVLVVVGIAVWCIYSCCKPVSPAAAEANLSTPTAVTCLPAQRVVKSSATTQPAPVSSDLKQGVVRVPLSTAPQSSTPQPPAALPPSSAPPSTVTPNESDDERFQRRTRERVAKFEAVTIEIPPVPAPIIETPSRRRPSAEFRRTLESREETELAPNTVKLDRYERERSRRMLKAVGEGDQPRKKKSSSTIEDVM